MNKLSVKNDAGLMTLALRLVVGWTYFSAFYRRTILVDKLDPNLPGYIGEKFNHFLPNALGIKPMIQHLVENPDLLWWNMVIFTIIEGIVGLFIMFGLYTRLMSIGVFGLALGILLGSGWIGTTCLDEWQIGVLGVASGFILFLTGSGKYSIDYQLIKKESPITKKKWFKWIGSGELTWSEKRYSRIALFGSIAIFGLTLFTNQVFHNGLWGKLHNKSVRPKIEISAISIQGNKLEFDIYRTEGVDVYGSWVIGIELLDKNGNSIIEFDQSYLSDMNSENIDNYYVTKIKPSQHSLKVPLGGKANLTFESDLLSDLKNGKYSVKITDISGISWTESFRKE